MGKANGQAGNDPEHQDKEYPVGTDPEWLASYYYCCYCCDDDDD